MAPAGGGGNIKVVVRVRPLNGRERDRRAKCIVEMKDGQTILHAPADVEERARGLSGKAASASPAGGGGGGGARGDGPKTFAFDKSYWSVDPKDAHFAGQEDLFADLGQPLLENAFQARLTPTFFGRRSTGDGGGGGGYNNCILAYGQTGSGKSYSMMGYGDAAGVIPRICQDMFQRIEGMRHDATIGCTVEVSYLEIYNERVRDLLNPATKGNLKVREHPSTGPYVEDLAKLVVRSFPEIGHLMDEGNKARTVAATNMNETSSRSHAVFTLTLTQKRHDRATKLATEKVAKINLVDLAGSERATATGATGARLKEGAEINRSLSTLGRVISALAELSTGKRRNVSSMVPYRDSVLTWLLKDSLGGNSMTSMIAAISPADINYEETLSTLRYADSAKRIKNHAVVNEDPNARMIRELQAELAQLRQKLTSGSGAAGLADRDAADTPLEQQMVSIVAGDGSVKQVSKAEIAEQLNQSEKLYHDLNQTWEEKLQRTEQIQKEREAALEELGISIETGFVGLHTPKRMPHLVNLSDDPLLAECLVYNLKPGTTAVGNLDAAAPLAIRLNGTKVLPEHCVFEHADGVVTIVPRDGAAVMVNGLRIERAQRLRTGYRIVLGDFHIFRFNHPEEARAERAEHSLLRHSFHAGPRVSPPHGTATNGDGHTRAASRTDSEYWSDADRAESPGPTPKAGRDSDWFFARREAAHAILGPDQKVSQLTDDELDVLFEEVHRVRAVRRGRPESRLENADDDLDSVTSFSLREKYASMGTMDDVSLDTAITLPSTLPSTPQPAEVESRRGRDGGDDEGPAKSDEAAHRQMEEMRAEHGRMEEALRTARQELQQQRDQVAQVERARRATELQDWEKAVARSTVQHWRQQRTVHMAEAILQHAVTLKEAQVMGHAMKQDVSLQFVVVDDGHALPSSYDMVLHGISVEEDEELARARKPCIGVRVLDFKHSVIRLWSLDKLPQRLRLMRQMHQYMDRPEYRQHLDLANPFSEPFLPRYSLIGDADVPLAAVFASRVQDFSLEVVSPYTFAVAGIVRLSVEPSAAQAPPSTLKFNVVMHDLVGLAEREGTDVHAQLFIPGVSEEDGATTTQLMAGFDDGPVRFASVHSLRVPQASRRRATLRVSVFARVTALHLDKLLSWDAAAGAAAHPAPGPAARARLPEREFFAHERHDVFARCQIAELAESGAYVPVEVVQRGAADAGAYQLHQGLQRRITVRLTYSAVASLRAPQVCRLRIRQLRLVDPAGHVVAHASASTPAVDLRLAGAPRVTDHAAGTREAVVTAPWDSSQHASPLLDRTTAPGYRVRMSLWWQLVSSAQEPAEAAERRLAAPMEFHLELDAQMQARTTPAHRSAPGASMLSQLLLWNWNWSSAATTRVVHSTSALFAVTVRPRAARRAADLWRMDTQADYVPGQERLAGWTPRGVELVHDFARARRLRRRVVEIEAAKGTLRGWAGVLGRDRSERLTPEEGVQRANRLLRKYVGLWRAEMGPLDRGRGSARLGELFPPSPPPLPPRPAADGARSRDPGPDHQRQAPSRDAQPTRLVAEVQLVAKNPSVLKAGYLLAPDDNNTHWVRRFVQLRRPYLHLHAVPDGDEINVVNLAHARIDHQPQFGRLLRRPHVWAVYAPQNTFLFAARSEREKIEWILRIDQSYFGGGAGDSGEE
ncbi:MAG: kinesin-like protein Klp8 [Phylliscum demangeonii]|nr:MAG: kinesin-like protein Klp8 [Phylliscum demangeonii]